MMAIRALVVDDSGIVRKMVMRSLSQLGEFEFDEAGDGREGLAKFDPQKTDIVFADWNMPVMSGVDMIRELRKIQTRHVPIVMITTEGTMGKISEALDDAGVDKYIVKPFDTEKVQHKVVPLIREIKAAKAAPPPKRGFFSKLVG